MTDRATVQGRKKQGWSRAVLAVLAGIVGFGLFWWAIGYLAATFTQEATDDAFLEGHVIGIAPKVPGQVSAVYVTHNQAVSKGSVLFEIDPRDLEVALEQKRAGFASAQANEGLVTASFALMRTRVETAEAAARQAEADAAASRATAERAEADLKRAEGLMQQKILSQQEFDAARAAAISAQATLRADLEKAATETSRVREARQQLEAARSALDQAKAQVGSTQADVKAAELNLSYAKVLAPSDGVIARKNVEPGAYVQVGQQLLALVPNDFWVVANFKETQLAQIHPGERVEVEIDSVPDRIYRAHVDSIQPGSGSRFSLLPPENAVGNFVKVVQRVPVKIGFDEKLAAPHRLGPGMSVHPVVFVSSRTLPEWVRGLAAMLLALLTGWIVYKMLGRRGEPEHPAM